MKNVIDAKDRFGNNQQTKRVKLSLEERLVSEPRLKEKYDRVRMAENLGELCERLSPGKPLAGARRIFEKAARMDKWDKRKRLVRLPGEPASSPEDYGAYEALSKTWAALANAAADLLSRSEDAGVKQRERENIFREIMRGTSLNPDELPMPTGIEGVRNLVTTLAGRFCKTVDQASRIKILWDILRSSPIDVKYEDREDQAEEREPVQVAHAAKRASEIEWYADRNCRFTTNTDMNDWKDWCYPQIKLGALALRSRYNIFILPPDIIEDYEDLSAESIEWLQSIGAMEVDSAPRFCLPPVKYEAANGYGWKEMECETTRNVWLYVRPRDNGQIGVYLEVEGDLWSDCIPKSFGLSNSVDIVAEAVRRRTGRGRGPIDDFVMDEGNGLESVYCVFMPRWAAESQQYMRPFEQLGLVQA